MVFLFKRIEHEYDEKDVRNISSTMVILLEKIKRSFTITTVHACHVCAIENAVRSRWRMKIRIADAEGLEIHDGTWRTFEGPFEKMKSLDRCEKE